MRVDARQKSPDAKLAAAIAKGVASQAPVTVSRFTTGMRHYVYEATFADRAPLVVRIGGADAHAEMAGALYLSGLLRPRGAPLPEILAHDLESDFPWLALERLDGVDLGDAIRDFTDFQRDRIAAEVARVQSIAARTGGSERYGIAVRPEQAPHARWSDMLEAELTRSRWRISTAGLFDVALADIVQTRLNGLRAEADAVPATPYLHDTTTKNVIVTPEGEVSGIVDVDDLGFGDPRYPAALTLAVLIMTGGPVGYVASWLRHAQAADDRLFRLYVALHLLGLMSEHGHSFNGNQAPSSPAVRSALRRALDEALAQSSA